jgi:hypothetical protein
MLDSEYHNVTPMKGREQSELSPSQRSKLLQDTRDLFTRRMSAAMAGMMDKVDDTLFEMADKSENNALQSVYFDAMREIRIKRPAIETVFKQKLIEAFQVAPQRKRPVAAELNLLDPVELELELVEDDTLETSIATQNMEQKIDANCKQELYALEKRVALLLDQLSDDENFKNPMGAGAVARAIEEAIGKIDSGVKIRLIVLKLFDKYVANDLNNVFAQVNTFLIKNKILPQIRTRVQGKEASGSTKARITVSETEDGIEVSSEGNLFATLQQLLGVGTTAGAAAGVTGLRGISTPGAVPFAPGGAANANAGGVTGLAALPVPTVAVVHDLTALQQGNSAAIATQAGIDPNLLSSGTVNVLRDLKSAAVVANMDQANQMTFDIVAMLFDYILDDKDIPDKMKALIGRLQIPLVKVAIIDKEFFAKKSHPARRLLNLLAQAALGWVEEQGEQDPLFRAVNSVVQKILKEFDDDIELFAKLLERFERFLNEQERQAQVRADRTAKVIQGRERLQVAKTKAQREITRRTYKRDISPAVLDFLSQHWRNLLISAYLEGGEEGEAWMVGIETMSDLIWSVIPKRNARDRQKLNDLLPGLIKRLKQGMERISMDLAERRQFLATLANRHTEVVRVVGPQANTALPSNRNPDLTKVVLGQTSASSAAPSDDAELRPATDNLVKFPTPEPQTTSEIATADDEVQQPTEEALKASLRPESGEASTIESDAESISAALRKRLADNPADNFVSKIPEEDEFVQEMDEHVFDIDEPEFDHDGQGALESTGSNSKSTIAAIAEHADPEIKRLLESGEFDLEELTLGDEEEDLVNQEPNVNDEFTEMARALEKGSWVEFHETDGSTKRARLTWVSSVTNVYLFTDRNGLKAGDRTLNGLAADFRRGSAKVIDDIPLFDRAVSKLLDGLGQQAATA